MLKIINSNDETILELYHTQQKTVSTVLKFNLDTQRFLSKAQTIQMSQTEQAIEAKKALPKDKQSKLANGDEATLEDMTDQELEAIINLSKGVNMSKEAKMELTMDLIKLLTIDDVEMSIKDANTIFEAVMKDPANQMP